MAVPRRINVEAQKTVTRSTPTARYDIDDACTNAALRSIARAADDLQTSLAARNAVQITLARILVEKRTAIVDAVELIADFDACGAANRKRVITRAGTGDEIDVFDHARRRQHELIEVRW